MNNYSLSVIIPNYNNAAYISDCVKSVVFQSYPVEKIIVVDDCSTDNSLEILNSLAAEYDNLYIVPLNKNSGVSHARNSGLAIAETPYVTFLDADDIYFNNDKLKNEMSLIKYYKETFDKDIIAYSKIAYMSSDGTVLPRLNINRKYYHEGNIFSSILTEKYFFTIMRDFCIPTKCIKAVGGYDETSCFWEDLDLILSLSKNTEFYFTNDFGTAYRQTNSGLSSRPKSDTIIRKREIFNKHTAFFSKSKVILYRILKAYHHFENIFIIYRLRLKRKLKKFIGRH